MKNKKILKIVLLSILAVIVIVVAALCIRFKDALRLVTWDNIVSLVNSQRYSTDELETQLDDNKKKMETIAVESPHINIRGDLTEEESTALKEGKITKDDAVGIVKGDTTLEEVLASKDGQASQGENKPSGSQTEGDKPPESKPAENESPKPENEPPAEEAPKDRVSEIVAELYVVQADFIARLEAVGDAAYADYKAIHYDRSQITAIVDSYTGTVANLEAECDATVRALLSELETELNKVGGDLSLVSEIRQFYYKEKSLKKSYYLNKMNDEDYK